MLDKIIRDTTMNAPHLIKPADLGGLIYNTTGDAAKLAMSGVITRTSREEIKHVDSTMSGTGGIGHVKTQPKRYGQVPFNGNKY